MDFMFGVCAVTVRFRNLWSFVLKVIIKQAFQDRWAVRFQSLCSHNRHAHPLHRHTPHPCTYTHPLHTHPPCTTTTSTQHTQNPHANPHTKNKIHTHTEHQIIYATNKIRKSAHTPKTKQRRVNIRSETKKNRKLRSHKKLWWPELIKSVHLRPFTVPAQNSLCCDCVDDNTSRSLYPAFERASNPNICCYSRSC